jgi:hypothetical protein
VGKLKVRFPVAHLVPVKRASIYAFPVAETDAVAVTGASLRQAQDEALYSRGIENELIHSSRFISIFPNRIDK